MFHNIIHCIYWKRDRQKCGKWDQGTVEKYEGVRQM